MNLHTKSLMIFLALAIAQTHGAIHDHISQLPTHTYDYIIVGGGTAGNVLANRLTEDSNVQVLVLEAGGSNEGVLASIIPLLTLSLISSQYDWNYTTTSQSGFGGRSIPYARGKILGGSSSINTMIYTTGSKDDWDHISRITGDSAWTWDAMAPYRDLNQNYVPPNDNHNDTGQYLPSAHSHNGMVPISVPGYSWPIDSRILAATNEPAFTSEFPFQQDMNIGNPIGFGWAQGTIGHGRRSSSATTYVGPDYVNRPNLHILLNAHATKLLEATDPQSTIPCFNGVEFGTGRASEKWRVSARKEVILSAGVFNTPQLLMLSGIGDSAELKSLGIPTRVNLPSVGKNMTDHVLLPSPWQVSSNETFGAYLAPNVLLQMIQEWNQTHQGPLSWTVINQIAWLRLPENDTIIRTYGDPSPGPTSAHIECLWGSDFLVLGAPKPDGNWMTMATSLISPTSRGTVKPRSLDPFDPPLIDPNFLATDFDMKIMIKGVKLAKRFATAQSWKGFIGALWEPLDSANTDDEIVQYVRKYSTTGFHAVGTAGISGRGAPWGVLDPDLRVKGTRGLRVVDGSALPYVPTAHTQGPIYLLAEVAAAKIKAEW